MADSSTTNYNLVKPEVGASGNTWGNKINANMDTIDSVMKSVADEASDAADTRVAWYSAGDPVPVVDGGPIYHADYRSIMEWMTFSANGASFAGYASIDVGTPIFIGENTARKGTIKMNGASYSMTTYAALWNWAVHNGNTVALGSWEVGTFKFADNGNGTFKTPDLRGRTPRAWSDGSSVDSGRARGSAQADGNKSHTHTFTGTTDSAGSHVHAATGLTFTGNALPGHSHGVYYGSSGGGPAAMSAANNGGSPTNPTTPVSAGTPSGSIGGSVASNGAHTHPVSGSVASDGNSEVTVLNTALSWVVKF